MSASRSSSVRVLRQLASSSHSTTQIRRLHMLDPAIFPATKKPITKVTAAPAAEQNLSATAPVRPEAPTSSSLGSSSNIISTPVHSTGAQAANNQHDTSFHTRHFTTTRNLGATRDSSSIDFAYLPKFTAEASNNQARVPLAPWNFETTGQQNTTPEVEPAVHRPIISTVAGEATHISAPSAMSEIVDSTSGPIDIQQLSSTLTTAVRNSVDSTTQHLGEQAEKANGMVKQVLYDMMDDLLGSTKGRSRS